MKYEILKIMNDIFNFRDFKDDLMKLESVAFHPDIQEEWDDKLELLQNAVCVLLCVSSRKIVGEAYTVDSVALMNDGEDTDSQHLNEIALLMEQENAVYLCSLAVLPEYEGIGIANEFMKMLIHDAKHKGYTAIYSHAHEGASAHIHEKFGGKEVLRRENWYDTGATHILYKITL
jgi:N-acetylglutamate synthase-like GNAT family acetyltransferase